MNTTTHTWIDTDEGLARLGKDLAGERGVAVDTESDGFHHYFDKLCLLQLSTREANFLVDPLAVSSLDPLRPMFADQGIRKVMHAAEQDIMYLRRDHHLEVKGLFDTAAAAQLTGRTRLGLAALLEAYFEIHLSKSNQRDDWSLRPLNPAQLAYAVSDTNNLLALADLLEQEVREKGRQEWADEEYRALEQKQINLNSAAPDEITRVKGWKDLPPRGRAVLRELLRGRDCEARKRDRPPFRIAPASLLLELAAKPPADIRELQSRKGFPRQRSSSLTRQFMDAVTRGLELPESEFPQPPPRAAHPGQRQRRDAPFEERVNRLRAWRKTRAEQLGLEPGVVISQRDLEAVAENPPGSQGEDTTRQGLRQWRWREFSAEWRQLLS
ncbi:MAG: HRDC domain-containing protein [Acidobacteria bacterium]|nr:HRDC domain-containing protein [Acidobacteriota bacterium]